MKLFLGQVGTLQEWLYASTDFILSEFLLEEKKLEKENEQVSDI